MKDSRYFHQVELMLKTIPHVTAEPGWMTADRGAGGVGYFHFGLS